MTPKKFAIAMFVWFLCFLCMLSGLFTAAGIAAYFFGGGEYGSIGVIQNKTNAGFWVFILLLAPFMLVGAAGGVAAIVLPAYCKFGIPMRRKGRPVPWLDSYVRKMNQLLEDEW